MTTLSKLLRRFWHEESGQDLIEYGLLLAIIALASVIAYTTIPAKMTSFFGNRSDQVYDLWEPDDPIPPSP